MYSNANAIEPSNTSTQTGGQAPIRTAAVMQVIKATTPKVTSRFAREVRNFFVMVHEPR
jgi:hypothetical protein